MNKRGFSLIELMIVVLIIGIIVTFAIPSYKHVLEKSRRAEAQSALMELAAKMERYYTENHSYVGATLSDLNMPANTENGFYTLSLSNLAASTYTLTATPQGTQTADTKCSAFSLNQLGQKTVSGTASSPLTECW